VTNVKSTGAETPAFTTEHLQASKTFHPILISLWRYTSHPAPSETEVSDAIFVNYMCTVKTAQEFRRLGMTLIVILLTHAAHKPTHNNVCGLLSPLDTSVLNAIHT
jgi:hypothetical protein